jgi:NAD(P)H-flavin reductase
VELLVKRGSRVADALVAAATAGQRLQASGPFGPGFAAHQALGRDVLLFAAGSGIAPVRALIQELVRRRPEIGRVTLYYGQRAAADFAYRAEHLAWERAGVRVYLCCSDPAARAQGWEGPIGRAPEVAERTLFGGHGLSGAVAFACGKREMLETTQRGLEAAGLPSGRFLLNT